VTLEPDSSPARLTIVRDTPDDIQDRWIRLWLDGNFWDTLRYGKTLSIDLSPGPHRLKASNTLNRDTLDFDAKPGEQIKVRCHNAIARGGFLSILMIGVAIIRVRLERIDG
jgi:hypothetical protein